MYLYQSICIRDIISYNLIYIDISKPRRQSDWVKNCACNASHFPWASCFSFSLRALSSAPTFSTSAVFTAPGRHMTWTKFSWNNEMLWNLLVRESHAIFSRQSFFGSLLMYNQQTNQPTKQMPKYNMYFLSQKVKPAGAAAGAASASQGLISGCQALAMTNSINWRHTSNQTDN